MSAKPPGSGISVDIASQGADEGYFEIGDLINVRHRACESGLLRMHDGRNAVVRLHVTVVAASQ